MCGGVCWSVLVRGGEASVWWLVVEYVGEGRGRLVCGGVCWSVLVRVGEVSVWLCGGCVVVCGGVCW